MMKSNLSKVLLLSLTLCLSSFGYADTNDKSKAEDSNDHLVFALPVKIEKLDPTLLTNAHTKFTLPLIFESLITVNSNQELKPVLAKTWEVALDKKSIIINLKQHHRFSDGSEVTANDVVQTFYRLCGASSQESNQISGLRGCKEHRKNPKINPEVVALNDYQVKFNITNSPTTFLYQLASPNTVITKVAASDLIGSSTYKIADKNDNSLLLNKNPFYFGDVKIANKGIKLIYINDASVQSAMMKNQFDGSLMYRMESLWNFKNDNYKLIRSNSNITEIFVLNNQRFPFNNPILRKAINNELYNHYNSDCSHGSHQAYGIVPRGIGGSITNIAPDRLPEISVDEILAKIPDLNKHHAKVTIHQLNDLHNTCLTQQIINAGKKYRIDITFKDHKDYKDFFKLFLHHNLDGFIELYVFKNREADNILDFFAKNSENHANITDDTIDKLLHEAVATSSSHNRFQVYNKITQYIQNNNIVIPLFYMDHGNLMNKCLSGIPHDFFFNPFLELPKISKNTQYVNATKDSV